MSAATRVARATGVPECTAGSSFDVEAVRRDFPILAREVNGRPLCYLDNAASSQRPRAVIDAVSRYYETSHANVHRGVHRLSQEATDLFEGARETLRRFVNARSTREIVLVRGTTEAINLVAQSYARPRLGPGDEILVSWLEHHANIVPWQMVCGQTGARLRVIPMTRSGEVDFEAFVGLLGERTRLLALSHVSNALGTVVPVERFILEAKRRGIPVLLDGAQAVPHLAVDVQALDCDFYAFSGHKMCGPTGIGVLYGRESLLAAMPPWQGGGDMILAVSFERTVYNELPWKFEAGTPHIAGAVGLGAAVDYLEALGMDTIARAEHELLDYATARLAELPGVEIVGTAPEKAAVVSFTLAGVHPHDLGTILDAEGVAIRTGHHCAMPVMEFYGVPATARASFAFYNTRAEVDRLVDALRVAREMLA
jgi:cysteine desulfurase/selenocysteine lyase